MKMKKKQEWNIFHIIFKKNIKNLLTKIRYKKPNKESYYK